MWIDSDSSKAVTVATVAGEW